MTELWISIGGGIISGFICVVAMKIDISWLKKEVEEVKTRLYNLEVRNMK